jgi:hypothetical protein
MIPALMSPRRVKSLFDMTKPAGSRVMTLRAWAYIEFDTPMHP